MEYALPLAVIAVVAYTLVWACTRPDVAPPEETARWGPPANVAGDYRLPPHEWVRLFEGKWPPDDGPY